MKFVLDHDYHIHSLLSSCSQNPAQTPERILKYALDNNYTSLCLTNHFWDETIPGASDWYAPQNYEHIKQSLPLPQADGVRFLFGAEVDMDKYGTIGISHKVAEELDFFIVPTTHLHMPGFTIDESIGLETESDWKYRADRYVERWNTLLEADLPFEKMGIAHLTTGLICRGGHAKDVLRLVPDETFRDLFTRSAKKGLGIELNFTAYNDPVENLWWHFRVFRIAMECGCKFYFGSDAHRPEALDSAYHNFEIIRDTLGLEESQKFHIATK